jgi:2-dehydropantoate 2-reductase
MRIALIGAGAIGSLAAAYLTRAGEDVLLVGRARQVHAIQKKGLIVKEARLAPCDFQETDGQQVIPVRAALRLDHPVDLVIFTVKTQDLEQAYQDHAAYLDGALLMTSQNGVQADNMLSIHLDRSQMISSIVMFGATYTRPGEVTDNFPGDWIIAKPFAPNDANVHAVADILKKAFPVVISDNIEGMKWLKLFINFNNCLPALIGKSMQETFADLDFCRLSVMLLKEGVGVVEHNGIKMESLPRFPVERICGLAAMPMEKAAGIMNKTLTSLSREPLYGSILQSIMRGRPSEIDFINGEVVQIAKSSRMESPLNRRVVQMVHEVEESGKFFPPEMVKKEFDLRR